MGVVIGGAIGWLYHIVAGKNYKVSMVVEYNILDKKAYLNVFEQLNLLVSTGSKDKLANALGVSQLMADNVNKIEATNITGQPLETDTNSSILFRVNAGMKSPFGVDSLGIALLNYVNGLPYLKKDWEERVRIMKEQLSFIKDEMSKMDSLKREYSRSLTAVKVTSGYYINVYDPVSMYRQSYSLDSMRTEINKTLIHGDKALQVISPFRGHRSTSIAIENDISFAVWMIFGFLLAFIFALLPGNKEKNLMSVKEKYGGYPSSCCLIRSSTIS